MKRGRGSQSSFQKRVSPTLSSWESNLDGIPSRGAAIAQEEGSDPRPSKAHPSAGDGVADPITETRNKTVLDSSYRDIVIHHPQQPPCTGCGERVKGNLLVITYQGKPRMSSQRTIPYGSFRDAITRREDEPCWVALVQGLGVVCFTLSRLPALHLSRKQSTPRDPFY